MSRQRLAREFGATDIVVTNRTEARAMQLAQRVGGTIVPFSDLGDALSTADVLLTCTGAGSIVIDHDLGFITRISDHIVVLAEGQVLAEGTPDEVRANPAVAAAYLGSQA